MTTAEPRARLAAALDADGPAAALAGLRWAFEWALQALGSGLPDPRSAAAVTAVIALDDALTSGEAFVAVVPRLVAAAQAPGGVEAELRRRQQELANARRDVATLRRQLGEAEAAEAALRACVGDRESLAERVEELRRLERLAAEVGRLRELRSRLEQRLDPDAKVAVDEERSITQAANRLVEGGHGRLAGLREATVEILERLARQDQELSSALREQREANELLAAERDRLLAAAEEATVASIALQADVNAAQERYERIEAGREALLEAASRYAAADRAVLDALDGAAGVTAAPDLDAVREGLDEVQRRLRDIDGALGRALAIHADTGTAAHAIRRLGAAGPGLGSEGQS
jgi:chromosome segregation ATPase